MTVSSSNTGCCGTGWGDAEGGAVSRLLPVTLAKEALTSFEAGVVSAEVVGFSQ